MLSLAPAAGGFFEWDEPGKRIFDDASAVLDERLAGAGPIGRPGITPQGISLEGRSLNLLVPPIVPDVLPLLPHLPPDIDLPPSAGPSTSPWGETPPWSETPDYPHPGDSPDPSDPGGMLGIGGLENTTPGIFASEAAEREVFAVLQLLAALKYRPANAHPDSESSPDDPAVDAEIAAPAAELRGVRSGADLPEGGMVALAVDAVFARSSAEDFVPAADLESWLENPAQMDSAYGKFQAFEVSTTEAAYSPASIPEDSGTGASVQPTPAAAAIPVGEAEPMREIIVPTDDLSSATQLPDDLTPEEAVLPPTSLRGSGANTSTSLKAAAAALYLAYAARAARRQTAVEPDVSKWRHAQQRVPLTTD